MLTRDEFYEALSVFIKKRRKELKLTNESVFVASGVDLSKVSTLQNCNINKTRGCTAYTLYKILLALGVDLFKPSDDRDKLLHDSVVKLEGVLNSLKEIDY